MIPIGPAITDKKTAGVAKKMKYRKINKILTGFPSLLLSNGVSTLPADISDVDSSLFGSIVLRFYHSSYNEKAPVGRSRFHYVKKMCALFCSAYSCHARELICGSRTPPGYVIRLPSVV